MAESQADERAQLENQIQSLTDNQAFDPKQDISEKRWLRKEYRQLIQQTEENRAELLESNPESLVTNLQSANTLYSKVKNPYEATLDARLLILSADIGTQKAKKMRIEHDAFDTEAYLGRLQGLVRGTQRLEGFDRYSADSDTSTYWSRIGAVAAKYSCRAPASDFMFGPLLTERRQHTVNRTRHARQQRTEESLVQPQQLEEGDIEKQENETTKNVKDIFNVLERVGPINLFEFVVNPDSFAQTIENIFYLSFLIRDGRAYIDDDSGQPMLECCMPPSQEDYAEGLVKKQLVMELDYSTWEEIKEVYCIYQPTIPTRKQTTTNVNGKWYG